MVNVFSALLWRIIDGDTKYRSTYALKKDSVVWDVGGYVGEWSQNIVDKYDCYVHIFEPSKKYSAIIEQRFKEHDKVIVHHYGLLGADAKSDHYLSKSGLGASVFGKQEEPAVFQDVSMVVCGNVDVMKVNIEGGEYPLLFSLISSGKIALVQYLEIQFHDNISLPSHGDEQMRDPRYVRKILRRELKKTHYCLYSVPFLWEAWVRNKA